MNTELIVREVQIKSIGEDLVARIELSTEYLGPGQPVIAAAITFPLETQNPESPQQLLQRLRAAAPRLLNLDAIRQLGTPQPPTPR